MKTFFLILAFIGTMILSAQEGLNFDKKFIQSEDKWVAFPADSTGAHIFGFIYIDEQAGLTFDYSGTFSIDSKGIFIPKKRDEVTSIKTRLQPNNNLIAFIPDSKFNELDIKKTPEWLRVYKENENSIDRYYKWGYRYNGWGECQKALEFLEKANKIDPNYKGLAVELAFSYNCLEQFEKAIKILEVASVQDPKNAYVKKELIYALINDNQLDKAVKTYRLVLKEVPDKTHNAENAFNILGAYFGKGDFANFNKWLKETGIENDKRFQPYVQKLKQNLKK